MARGDSVPVKIVRPEQPEARDEGPRLIPLKEADADYIHTTKIAHYMKLADIALKSPRANKEGR